MTSTIDNKEQRKKQQFSNQHYQYGNKIIDYTLIRSKRRKTCEIIVDKDEIILRAPFDKSIEDLEGILYNKIKWISVRQKGFRLEVKEIIKPVYEDNSTLPYLGINYDLRIVFNNKEIDYLDFDNNRFVVYLGDKRSEQIEIIKTLYTRWLNDMASRIFKEKVDTYSNTIGVIPKKIVLKNLKNRWGSLTKDGVINLNINLIKASDGIIDYVIIHELCHLKVLGHSHKFWHYLKQFVPDYEQKIQWLKRNTGGML